MLRRLMWLLVIALTANACGDSTGPSKPSLTGNWSYNAVNMSGQGGSCRVMGVTLQLNQTGDTFTGNAVGGTIYCTYLGQVVFDGPRGSQSIGSGMYVQNAVNFTIGSPAWTHSGTLAGSTISGTTTMTYDAGYAALVLTGQFNAVRQ